VIVDPSRVPQGTRVVERQLQKVENRSNALRNSLTRTFGVLAAGTLARAAIRSIAKFEESLATAQAVTKATGEEFEALRDRALELGLTTAFSAGQAADALVGLSRAGFSVNEAISSVGDTLNLARAGGLGLADATDIAATALRGFRLGVSESGRVVDVLVETSNRANTNVQQLGEALKFVAPIAAGLSQSLEATNAALGVLSDAGLKATLAGTGLRAVLAGIVAPSGEAEKVFSEFGLSAQVLADTLQKDGLVAVLEQLKASGVGVSEAFELFGKRGGPAFEVLVNQIPKLRELNTALEGSGGAAKKAADIIDNTLNGAVLRAKSALEGFVLAVGQAGTSDILIAIFDGIASSLRFLADNADILTDVMLGLSIAIGVRGIAGAVATALPLLRSFALTMVLVQGNVLAATAAMFKFNAVAALNPFVLLTVATVAAGIALKAYINDLNAAGRVLEQLEEDAKGSFNTQGAQIRIAQKELRILARIQEDQGFLSESQLAREKQLRVAIAATSSEIKEQSDQQREVNKAREVQIVTVDAILAKLSREAKALQDVTSATENRAKAEGEIRKLLQAGVVPGPEERQAIRNAIDRNEQLGQQRKLLESILGPQQQFVRDEANLNALLEAGSISAEQFKVKLAELKGEFETADFGGGGDSLQQLTAQNDLLQNTLALGELNTQALQLENQLRAEGVEITRELQDQIIGQVIREQELTEALKERRQIEIDAERARQKKISDEERIAALETAAIDRVAETINVQAKRIEQEELLQKARDLGLITDQQLIQAQMDLQLAALETSTALEDGFTRAFIKISNEANNFAAVAEAAVNAFADSATEALVNFVETGKFSSKDFASSLLKEITRIIIRLLVVQAIQAATGTGPVGGIAGGAVAGARQQGGTVQPSRSFVVGENGPELFVPDRTGTIVPNAKDQPAQAAPMTVQVVNVQSEDDIPQAINDGGSDEAIINLLARNKDRVSQALA